MWMSITDTTGARLAINFQSLFTTTESFAALPWLAGR